MAKCAICEENAGFAPARRNINGTEFPICTTCNMNYMNLDSKELSIKILATDYFREKASTSTEKT